MLKTTPALGTWVTLVPGKKGSLSTRDMNASKTPALVSGISIEGFVTVMYPNNFVLVHGFKGEPVKRVTVPLKQVRLLDTKDGAIQILEKAMRVAIKAGASSLRKVTGSPCSQSSPSRERMRSRSRSRSRCESSTETLPPMPCTPEVQMRTKSAERCLTREVSAEKVQSACAESTKIEAVHSKAHSIVLDSEATNITPKSWNSFVSVVGRALRASDSGRLTRDQLQTLLIEKGFVEAVVESGLQRLDEQNKILLCDELVFLV